MNHKILLLILLSYGLSNNVSSQDRPALVIGIVVDQMTNDYLYRFHSYFGNDGFNRLISGGYYYPNTFYNYSRTATGPGHASIYTGTTPSMHGIIDNQWYDEKKNKTMYCVEDNVEIWLPDNKERKRSPSNLIGSTIPDLLSVSSQGKSKTIGISLKDRSAILPIGHTGDLALWWDDEAGKWITSNYYMEGAPLWLSAFEKENPVDLYLKEWQYFSEKEKKENINFRAHDKFEVGIAENENTGFPYDLESMAEKHGPSIIKSTPFGNTYTIDLAMKAIQEEKMGDKNSTDFLCISFSSTDYIGHKFGPYSKEIEDTYVKLDKDLAKFLYFLDEQIGRNEYLIFLTSDHGVVPNIDYLKSQKIPGSYYNLGEFKEDLKAHLLKVFHTEELVLSVTENQIYLDHEKISSLKIGLKKITRDITDYLNGKEEIMAALSSQEFFYKSYEDFPRKEMKNSYYHGRSGDVLFTWRPYMRSDEYKKGTGHGSSFVYDRKVPLIWYGKGIKNGTSNQNVDISQIASTLADLLQIQRPPFCTAESLFNEISK